MNATWRIRCVRLLIAAHLGLLVLLALAANSQWVADSDYEHWYRGCFMAIPYAQLSLLAIWLAWGGGSWVRRLAWVVPLLLGTYTVFVWYAQSGFIAGDNVWLLYQLLVSPMQDFRELAPELAEQFLAVLVVLGAVRLLSRQRLAAATAPRANDAYLASPFGRREMLLWTVSLVALSGVGRWLVERDLYTVPFWSRAVGLNILICGNVLLALLAAWSAFSMRGRLLWVSLASLLAADLTAAEMLLIHQTTWFLPTYWYLLWLNCVQYLTVLGNLLILRLCGYQLEGRPAAVVES